MLVLCCSSLAAFSLERFAFGCCIGVISTATGTIAAYSVPASQQGLGISLFSLSTALSLSLGPFIGLGLEQIYGFDVVTYEVSLLCSLAFVLSLLLPATPVLDKKGFSLFKLSNYIDFSVLC